KQTLEISKIIHNLLSTVNCNSSPINWNSFFKILISQCCTYSKLEDILANKVLVTSTCKLCHSVHNIKSTSVPYYEFSSDTKSLINAFTCRTQIVDGEKCSICLNITTNIQERVYLTFAPILFIILERKNIIKGTDKYPG